jgi:hypothetical protein
MKANRESLISFDFTCRDVNTKSQIIKQRSLRIYVWTWQSRGVI